MFDRTGKSRRLILLFQGILLTGLVLLVAGCSTVPERSYTPAEVQGMLPSGYPMYFAVDNRRAEALLPVMSDAFFSGFVLSEEIEDILDLTDWLYGAMSGEKGILLLQGDYPVSTYAFALDFSADWEALEAAPNSWTNGIFRLQLISSGLIAVALTPDSPSAVESVDFHPFPSDISEQAFSLIQYHPGEQLLGGVGGALIPLEYLQVQGRSQIDTENFAVETDFLLENEADARPLTALFRLMLFGSARRTLPGNLGELFTPEVTIDRDGALIRMSGLQVPPGEIPGLLAALGGGL